MSAEEKRFDPRARRLRNKNHWLGSFYELGLAFEPGTLDLPERRRVFQAIWNDPLLQGVVGNWQDLGRPWMGVESFEFAAGQHVYGMIRLGKHTVGCGSFYSESSEALWFVLYLPLGMVELAYPVDYAAPLTHAGNPWTKELDEILAQIGGRVYRQCPFVLGVLGEEASAFYFSLKRLTTQALNEDPCLLVPEKLFVQMEVQPHGNSTSEELWWTGGQSSRADSFLKAES